jgi:hypothetical protein
MEDPESQVEYSPTMSFDQFDRDDLVQILKKVLSQNIKYRQIIEGNRDREGGDLHKHHEIAKLEFGSYGSSNVMFLKGSGKR